MLPKYPRQGIEKIIYIYITLPMTVIKYYGSSMLFLTL